MLEPIVSVDSGSKKELSALAEEGRSLSFVLEEKKKQEPFDILIAVLGDMSAPT